jgi:hypothetical protein
MLKTVVVAPIPMASESSAAAANPGALTSPRRPQRTSRKNTLIASVTPADYPASKRPGILASPDGSLKLRAMAWDERPDSRDGINALRVTFDDSLSS